MTSTIQELDAIFERKLVEDHKDDTCDFAGCRLWGTCSKCRGLYRDHNPDCKNWEYFWIMSVVPNDTKLSYSLKYSPSGSDENEG